MNSFYNNTSRRKIKVTILATYPLMRQSLRVLIDNERETAVLDAVGSTAELTEKISRRSPDVVLLCLMENEGKNVNVLHDLRPVAPQIKTVILSAPNSSLDQPAALKLGVMGIVGTNQNARVLIRAITQVSEGEVWLNQKLLAQLLNNDFTGRTANRERGKTGKLFKGDDVTARELEVVALIGLGMNNRDISKRMFISEATVRHHLSSIYSKLGIEDRLNLAIYAHQRLLIPPLEMSAAGTRAPVRTI